MICFRGSISHLCVFLAVLSVKNTGRSGCQIHIRCSEGGCGHWFGQEQWDFWICKVFSFFCWKLQKCKNTKMRKCAPQWPFRTREMVPTHPPGCVLTWSNLDPRRSAISEPPGQLMATRGPFMAIWTVFGHKMGKNGWIKSMSIWIKTLLNPTDNLHSLVFTKRQLRNSPPP